MKAYKCDRCGKLFEKYEGQGTRAFYSIVADPYSTGTGLDLCPKCNDELQEWVDKFTIKADKAESGRMTREEAIKIIKNYDVNGCGYCHQGGDEVEEAFDIAIEALEQELKWIPVSERLPDFHKEVLTCCNGGFIEIQSLEDSDDV